jgi:hypothetical protein
MNRKTLIAGAAGALALAGTVAIAQTAQQPAAPSSADTYSTDSAATAQSADTAATDTATTTAGERG